MTTYNVALKEGIDYDQFWHEVETSGLGGATIPKRAVDIVNERPTSLRQCWYDLTEEEANTLSQDPRVYCVEIPPEFRTDIEIVNSASQTGLYYKVFGTNPANNNGVNWGLFRIDSRTNNTPNTSGTLTYDYNYDGTGVDVVIMDGGCQIDHPEFTDANNVSRVQQIDWFTSSGVSGTMPAFNLFYSDNDGHGTHVTGIAAGKTYGRAKNARIYIMSVTGLVVSPTVGIAQSLAFDCIKGWHNNKPIDPVTGYKRPTVVNMSWGVIANWISSASFGYTYSYRGEASFYPGNSPRQTQFGVIGAFASSTVYRFGRQLASINVDVQELLDAGVVLVGAAGNYYQTVNNPDGIDYNNWWKSGTTLDPNPPEGDRLYYMRGQSPGSASGVICVGNVDNSDLNGQEFKNSSSDSGPRIDVFAPGSAIVSAISNTNIWSATTLYPSDTNYKIASLTGTSQASPNVTGLVAQLLQQTPGATPAEIRQQVISLGTPNMLYDTGQLYDYTDFQSLHGASNNFAYIDANPPQPICSISNSVTLSGSFNFSF